MAVRAGGKSAGTPERAKVASARESSVAVRAGGTSAPERGEIASAREEPALCELWSFKKNSFHQ